MAGGEASAFAGCGHAVADALGGNGPENETARAVERCAQVALVKTAVRSATMRAVRR
jgi:hypothetical protein